MLQRVINFICDVTSDVFINCVPSNRGFTISLCFCLLNPTKESEVKLQTKTTVVQVFMLVHMFIFARKLGILYGFELLSSVLRFQLEGHPFTLLVGQIEW